MDDRTLWAMILIGLALILFILEVFIPSGGIIGLLAAGSLVGGVIMLFWINTTLGLISALVCIVAIPFAIAAMMKMWPNTPIFRALALQGPDEDSSEGLQNNARHTENQDVKVGDQGLSETPLRPVGVCRLNGRRMECYADGQMITQGQQVRVTHVDGMQIKVRAV